MRHSQRDYVGHGVLDVTAAEATVRNLLLQPIILHLTDPIPHDLDLLCEWHSRTSAARSIVPVSLRHQCAVDRAPARPRLDVLGPDAFGRRAYSPRVGCQIVGARAVGLCSAR